MVTRTQLTRLRARFLHHFRLTGNITTAAQATGVERKTIYNWQERDDKFAAAFREAEIEATERLEAEARRRAVDGVERLKFDRGQPVVDPFTGEPYREHEYSDTLLIFLLKARAPEKYADRTRSEVSGPGGQPIQIHTHADLSDADLDEKIRTLAETEA